MWNLFCTCKNIARDLVTLQAYYIEVQWHQGVFVILQIDLGVTLPPKLIQLIHYE